MTLTVYLGFHGSFSQRYHILIKRWSRDATLAVLACETQKKVHYAMPVRTMFYDSLSYMD